MSDIFRPLTLDSRTDPLYNLHVRSGTPLATNPHQTAPVAVLLSQGDEVVTGQTVDTNAAWLAERLVDLGFDVRRHVTVGDRMGDLVAALTDLSSTADVVIGTGGLGPTMDDLTASACASAFGRPLELDPDALAFLEALFARWGRPMADSNRKQAYLPQGSTRLDNARGTAPGFAFEHDRAWLAFLPGVPHEMKAMFDGLVVPSLAQRFALTPGRLISLRTTGVGESVLQDRIGAFEHDGVVIGTRAMSGECLVKLRFDASVDPSTVTALTQDVADRIGSPVYAIDGLDAPGGTLPQVVGRALLARGATLAVAESCTGGQLSALFTSVPGSSAWFLEGVVTYANASKVARLGVPEPLIATYGAVSEPVVRAMAEGVRASANTTYGIGVTGIAGPDGGTADKPVGTVHVALATPHGTHHHLLRLFGDRGRIQTYAAHGALDLLRRHLHGVT